MAKIIIVIQEENKVKGAVTINVPHGLTIELEGTELTVTQATRRKGKEYVRPQGVKAIAIDIASAEYTSEYIPM